MVTSAKRLDGCEKDYKFGGSMRPKQDMGGCARRRCGSDALAAGRAGRENQGGVSAVKYAGERKEMVRRVVHRRTVATAIRPWKAPLPKVSLPNLTLFDLIRLKSWITVKKRKHAHRKVAGLAPAAAAALTPAIPGIGIRAAREARLNSLLGRDGPTSPEQTPQPVGSEIVGYEA